MTGTAYHFELIKHDSSVGNFVAVVYNRVMPQSEVVEQPQDMKAPGDSPLQGKDDAVIEDDLASTGPTSYTWKMEKPSYGSLMNWDMMKNGFTAPFELAFNGDLDWMTEEDCPDVSVRIPGTDYFKELPFAEINDGYTFKGNYV